MRTRMSWREKLENSAHAKVVPIPEAMRKRFGSGTMLIPKPLDVDALIRRVPEGKPITTEMLRAALACAGGADVACPLVTGISIRIVAEAAEEDALQGQRRITPYWRVVRADGSLLTRIPGGAEAQGERLQAEGHAVEFGRKPRVRMADGLLARYRCASGSASTLSWPLPVRLKFLRKLVCLTQRPYNQVLNTYDSVVDMP
jgi:alkylated DNA nucleotide flippase Atl1